MDLSTGLFVLDKTDLVLPDVLPIALTRTYRQNDTVSRPFGIGATHAYDVYLIRDDLCTEMHLILPDGGRIIYDRQSGTNCYDVSLAHSRSPTGFFGSTLIGNTSQFGWDLTLKDGTVYHFDQSGPLQDIRDRFGNQVTLTRANGTTGNILAITSSNGRAIAFTYDAANRITQAKDHIGRIVTYTYDASGPLSQVTDPANGLTTYTYDSAHRMLTLKDARGIVFLTNAYDANGRVSRQTQVDGTTFQFAYTVDGTGKVTQTDVTDPRGVVRRVTFTAAGYTLTDTRAVGQPEQQPLAYEWQAGTNLLLSVTDALGRQTAYTYDAQANVTSVTRLAGTPDAVTTTLTYEPLYQQLASVTNPLNHTTTFGYDATGNLTSVVNALQQITTLSYNAAGQPLAVTSPAPISATITLGYDGPDLATVTDPLGRVTTRLVDPVGRLTGLSDPLGNLIAYGYDALNRLLKVTDAKAGVTAFTYDANGNLLTVKDAKAHSTTYTYNTMDRLTTRKDPLLKSESYVYDAGGNLTTFTDRKAQVTTFTYDALGRRTKAKYQDNSTTTYTYDAGNRLTQIVDSLSGTITLAYDNLDRLLSETTPQGSVSYTYDAAGRRTSMTVAGQPTVTYTYDDANRLTQITQGTNIVTLGYDAAGRRTSLTLPNGIVVTSGFDQASQLTSLSYMNGTTVLGDLSYTYNLAGNRVKVSGSWARTGLPQPVSTTNYNVANQQLKFGNTTLTYDLNGNLTKATDAFGSGTYTWDARNRLKTVTAPGLNASFAYDALGRRTTKTINGVSTSFLYDGLNPVQELSGASVTVTLLTGHGIDEYLTRTDAAGTRAFLPDALGSTLALADDAGTVQTSYTYEAFGGTSVTGATTTNPFQYTGRENDGSGLYYYRARYYHPRLQRFISEDPIRFAGGDLNLYGYSSDNPINGTDPVGLCSIDVRFNPIVPGSIYHAHIVTTDPSGGQWGFRGGPGGSNFGSSSSSSGSSSTQKSPGRGGDNSGTAGPFGDLTQTSGRYLPGVFPDYEPPGSLPEMNVLNNTKSCDSYNQQLNQQLKAIGDAQIPYDLTATNSNALAQNALTGIGLSPGQPPVWAPGWNTQLRY